MDKKIAFTVYDPVIHFSAILPETSCSIETKHRRIAGLVMFLVFCRVESFRVIFKNCAISTDSISDRYNLAIFFGQTRLLCIVAS